MNRVTGRNFKVEPRGCEKTKELFTDEEIEKALRNMYKSSWHRPKMKEFKAEYFLRASTIDQFKDFKPRSEDYAVNGQNKTKSTTSTPADVYLSRKEMLSKEYEG